MPNKQNGFSLTKKTELLILYKNYILYNAIIKDGNGAVCP